ncbi:major facilitator superfamily domain-containing protein [Lipomyces orientalis]|uniref:Major facilitator superfamily domain-containing protein n=1 Tax=Lipomyces orientalis TaxID=1233043 RepID=A0ACC3TLL3_9ASCO
MRRQECTTNPIAMGTCFENELTTDEDPSTAIGRPAIVNDAAEASQPAEVKKSGLFYLTVLMLCLVSIVASMDSVIVAATLPSIVENLKGTTTEAFWCGTGFLLAQSVTIPLYGTLSDIFGRKWNMIFAISLFLFGSILCGTAQGMRWLVGARVIQGLGAGGTLSLVPVIISDITSFRERGKYVGIIGLAWALGTNIGIPIGGAVGERSSWRWVFWINIPICAVCIVGLIYSLHLRTDRSSILSKVVRVDYLGMSVFIGASTSFLLGLTMGGTQHPWDSAPTLVPLILGLCGFFLFVLVEWKVPREPMIPLRIFRDRTAVTGFVGAFCHGLVFWAFVYYMIIFFLGAKQHGLLHSSLETLPVSAFVAPSAAAAGIITSKTLKFQKLLWLGWTMLACGLGFNALMTPISNGGVNYGLRVIPAIGAGLLFPTPMFAVQVKQYDEDIGIATSMEMFFRSLGQAFGVAIGGVIFQNQFDKLVTKAMNNGTIPLALVVPGAGADSAYMGIRRFPHSVQIAYQYVYADSLRIVWYVMTAIAGVGFFVSLAARNESLDRGTKSKQQFQHKRDASQEKATVP